MLQRAPVDTIQVRSFADECFEKQYPGVDFKETSVSLRTNRSDMFVVEYWWEAENQKQHYGYQIQSDGEQCQLLQEGKDITKWVMEDDTE